MNHVSIPTTENKKESASLEVPDWSFRALLTEGARAWNMSQGKLLFIMAVPGLALLAGVVSGLFGKASYKVFTGEDGVAETLQVLIWLAALVLSLRVIKLLKNSRNNTMATLYLLLGVGLFFIIGEEISWGQRFVGWSTPESMRVINKQDETNLHNIHGIGDTFKWLHLVVGAYGTFLPLVLLRSRKLARFREQLSLLVPHYTLVPFFLTAFVWRVYRNFFEAPKEYYFAVSEFTEVVEIPLAFGFAFFLLYQFRRLRAQQRAATHGNGRI